MMANLVIVAVPAADDEVWKVSSEKVPHMTICFLGDADSNPNVPKIDTYVADQAQYLPPFNLRVDHRGFLGSDEADVLFFADDIPWQVHDFRDRLLADVNIRSAYNSIPQHTKWSPHLTLGYPDTPANEDNWDPMGTIYVRFDKIAVWTGDYTGQEIVLVDKTPKLSNMDEAALAYSTIGGEFLEHHGVKGMRWGVRKADKTSEVTVTQKGKKLKPSGGHNRPASTDAARAAAQKQIKKKSGVAALTDEELSQYARRLQLEQQVRQLEYNSASPTAKFVKKILGQSGNQAANQVASTATNKAVKSALAKTALAAA
jgi:2'-5' RNA ligase